MAVNVFPPASAGGARVKKEKFFYSSDFWEVPEGVRSAEVTVVGGTAGSNSGSVCSGPGGFIKRTVELSGGEVIPVIVGAAGSSSGSGGASSFKNLVALGSDSVTSDQGISLDTSIPGNFALLEQIQTSNSNTNGLNLFEFNNQLFGIAADDITTTDQLMVRVLDYQTLSPSLSSISISGVSSKIYGRNGYPVISNNMCVIFAQGGQSNFILSRDGGATWENVNLASLLGFSGGVSSINFSNGEFYISPSTSDRIFITTDLQTVSRTISRRSDFVSRTCRIAGVSGSRIIEIFDNGNTGAATAVVSQNGGASWSFSNISGSWINPASGNGVFGGRVFWGNSFLRWYYFSTSLGVNHVSTTSVVLHGHIISGASGSRLGGSDHNITVSQQGQQLWRVKLLEDEDKFSVIVGTKTNNGGVIANINPGETNTTISEGPTSSFLFNGAVQGTYADQRLSINQTLNLFGKLNLAAAFPGFPAFSGNRTVTPGCGGPAIAIAASGVPAIPGPGIEGIGVGIHSGMNNILLPGTGVRAGPSATLGNPGLVIVRWEE